MSISVEPISVVSKDEKQVVKSKETFAEVLRKELRKNDSKRVNQRVRKDS